MVTAVAKECPSTQWCDHDLVAACLAGDERAWAALIEKYKNLVYSAPVKYRMQADDAADLFQSVWAEALLHLPSLRDVGALRCWLIRIALNKCYEWKRRQKREPQSESEYVPDIADPQPWLPVLAGQQELERLHRALATLPERCQTMIRLLFFSEPPTPYAEVASRLGLAVGSIGFIRGRCLQKLRRALEATP